MTIPPTLTPLERAATQRQLISAALRGALDLLEEARRRRPAGVTVRDEQLAAGLDAARHLLPDLAAYAQQLEAVRDSLAAQVAGTPVQGQDVTALALLSLVTGLQAACTPPVPVRGYVAPAFSGSYTAAQVAKAHADGYVDGYRAAAADVLARIANRLA